MTLHESQTTNHLLAMAAAAPAAVPEFPDTEAAVAALTDAEIIEAQQTLVRWQEYSTRVEWEVATAELKFRTQRELWKGHIASKIDGAAADSAASRTWQARHDELSGGHAVGAGRVPGKASAFLAMLKSEHRPEGSASSDFAVTKMALIEAARMANSQRDIPEKARKALLPALRCTDLADADPLVPFFKAFLDGASPAEAGSAKLITPAVIFLHAVSEVLTPARKCRWIQVMTAVHYVIGVCNFAHCSGGTAWTRTRAVLAAGLAALPTCTEKSMAKVLDSATQFNLIVVPTAVGATTEAFSQWVPPAEGYGIKAAK